MYEKITDKLDNGITLIALVVTIVVLLILAGVTISMLSGENGILSQAVKAKINIDQAVEEERITRLLIAEMQGNEITHASLQNACDKEFGEGKLYSKVFEDGTITILVKETGREYYIDKDRNINVQNTTPVDDEAGISGSGTLENPYQISSIEDLVGFSNNVNNGTTYSGKYIELTRDLDFKSFNSYRDYSVIVDEEKNIDLMTSLTSGTGFKPIGYNKYFQGNFNGNNYIVSNIYENYGGIGGFFGQIAGSANIKNLTITGNINSTSNYAGGIVGRSYSGNVTLENLTNKVNVSSDNGYVAGIISNTVGGQCSIYNCFNYGNMTNNTSSKAVSTGGIFGYSSGAKLKIVNCSNYGKIVGGAETHVYQGCAGIIGGIWSETVNVYNCSNYGEVSGKYRCGGIIGQISAKGMNHYIKNCINTGKVVSKSGIPRGILCGTREVVKDELNIENCYYIDSCTEGVGGFSFGTKYTENQMKDETLITELNYFVNNNEDVIETTLYEWKRGESNYPVLK